MKKILVCTDGSNYSEVCCRYAAWLARQTGAAIDLLYVSDLRQFEVPAVADLSGSLGIQPFEGMVAQLQDVERHKAEFIKEHAIKAFKDEAFSSKVEFHHETGILVDEIHDYAEKADLVLIGKRGENANFATEHLGSMLERVLRAVEKPCLVTTRAFKAIDHVAVAYDGGKSCRKALDFLIENEMFQAVDLHVISVAEGKGEGGATERLAEAEKKLNAAGLYPACQVLSGEVETAIADYVKHRKMNLLVMGAYGHSRIRDLIIGSTTTDLIRSCHVPILCFR